MSGFGFGFGFSPLGALLNQKIIIERSADGITWVEIGQVLSGEKLSDTGLDLNTNYYYRSKSGSNYSRTANTSTLVTFVLTATGTGAGVATLRITSNERFYLNLDGAAKFYSDAGGTLDESTSLLVKDKPHDIYIRCSTGTANLTFQRNNVTEWSLWTSGSNAPSLSGDISVLLKALNKATHVDILGNNTLSGSLAGLTHLTYFKIGGTNTISGAVTALTNLTYLYLTANNSISGSITNLIKLTYLYVLGTNTLSGSLAALVNLTYFQVEGSNTITGSCNLLKKMNYFYCKGSNTISGDIRQIIATIRYLYLYPCGMVDYTSGGNYATIQAAGQITIRPSAGYGLSTAEVDLLINEVAATKVSGRAVNVDLRGANAARSSASDAARAAIIADGGTCVTN